jgi:uncharacterized membrane protein YsdA (DUF1294 family)/cold shock CspA family protein
MRKKGKIRSWNDQKGFGFISPSEGDKQIFLHISAFANRNRRPNVGEYVTYSMSTDKQGRPCAAKATLPGDRLSTTKARWSGGVGAVTVAVIFFALILLLVFASKVPPLILGIYLAASVVTFIMYAVDKSAAKNDTWRTPESTLHWLSIIGGWPGALIAQQTLRHKSKKQSFRAVFWVTVFLNCGAFAWMLTPTGSVTVQSWIAGGPRIFNSAPVGTIEWVE